ncbi:unnamed protein product [Didymodactylos carnosus]|uniref:Uncharacterized protein n=1 Tax=Didymodactylos carnosus TaxID=1234261 RepID=A0A813PK37_9BILA|nr:unnamed protein product [Didymodactylos carnosus]CAF3535551.1 unnamed protein product [Didymodactylos carnosus]
MFGPAPRSQSDFLKLVAQDEILDEEDLPAPVALDVFKRLKDIGELNDISFIEACKNCVLEDQLMVQRVIVKSAFKQVEPQ